MSDTASLTAACQRWKCAKPAATDNPSGRLFSLSVAAMREMLRRRVRVGETFLLQLDIIVLPRQRRHCVRLNTNVRSELLWKRELWIDELQFNLVLSFGNRPSLKHPRWRPSG